MCIPWTDDLRIDGPLFQATVRGRLTNGIRRLCLFGTAGEGHAVTESQFDDAAGLFADACADTPDAHPIVGLITLSMATMVERVGRMLPPYRAVTDAAWARYKAWMHANLPHLLPDA